MGCSLGTAACHFLFMLTAALLVTSSHSEGQWWLDDFKLERLDGELKNVVQTRLSSIVVKESVATATATATATAAIEASASAVAAAAAPAASAPAAPAPSIYKLGEDYTVVEPTPTSSVLDPLGNFTNLKSFEIKRVASGRIPAGGKVDVSYNFLPGEANQMVGGRDVTCYVEPLYYSLMERAIGMVVKDIAPDWMMADGFDERMGMGRDSRTLDSKLTNGQILGAAINKVNTIVQTKSMNKTKLVIWADMVVKDHNGASDYSWLSGDGRKEPYWPAVDLIKHDLYSPLLLSWTYGTTPYDRQLISDDPAYFQSRKLPWVGCPWTDLTNVNLWADAVRNASERYGNASSASGMLCTNWGNGRLEEGLLPTARKSWNLKDRSGPPTALWS